MAFNRQHTQAEKDNLRTKMTGKRHTQDTKDRIKQSMQRWVQNNPQKMEERINRLIDYNHQCRDLMKKFKDGQLIEK